jgi:hypothetical protein
MRRKSFEEMLENYLQDTNALNKDTEPDLKTFKCHYFGDSDYQKPHEQPTLEKMAKRCRPCHCPHFRQKWDI